MEASLETSRLSPFPGDSEMAGRMRRLDWSRTELGPSEAWPAHLRQAVSLCLTSRFPILLWWGPSLSVLYNDAYVPLLGPSKHPRVLGRPGQECWGEIWNTIGEIRATGIASLVVDRNYRVVLGNTDRGIVLEKGQIVLEGASQDLAADSDRLHRHLGV